MDVVAFSELCESAGFVPVARDHFFYTIFKEEKENEKRVFFVRERKLFFDVIQFEHPFSVDEAKLFEIPLKEIQDALKQRLTMQLHIPPDKGYLPNHEGEEIISVLAR